MIYATRWPINPTPNVGIPPETFETMEIRRAAAPIPLAETP
jgi:hypothetical protein